MLSRGDNVNIVLSVVMSVLQLYTLLFILVFKFYIFLFLIVFINFLKLFVEKAVFK